MSIKIRPTTLAEATKVVKPLVRACSIPAKLKSSAAIVTSIREV